MNFDFDFCELGLWFLWIVISENYDCDFCELIAIVISENYSLDKTKPAVHHPQIVKDDSITLFQLVRHLGC